MEDKLKKHRYFAGPRRERLFQKGDFKYILLQQLKDKPSYGYEIIRELQERFHSFYTPSPGSVYPTLQMLEEMGYVSSEEREGKKVFTISDEGLRFLDEQKESGDRIRNQMENWWNPENVDDVRRTMSELEKIAGLLRDKARTADVKKLDNMRKVLARAYDEILKV
ncbi:PadR family transcriptional regulator [Chloroflexota bacterium]